MEICERQLMRLLTERLDGFVAEDRKVLRGRAGDRALGHSE